MENLLPEIEIRNLRTDGGTQPRAQMHLFTVAEYAEAMRGGAVFPPVVAFYDGTHYWLADGFHRHAAALEAKREFLSVEVRSGTQRDAVLFSLGANAAHGLRRTNADKRRGVETLLRDAEWRTWSDSRIAKQCEVSAPFVGNVRQDLQDAGEIPAQTVRRDAKGRVLETKAIGEAAPVAAGEPELFGPAEEDAPDTVPVARDANSVGWQHVTAPAPPVPEPEPEPVWSAPAAAPEPVAPLPEVAAPAPAPALPGFAAATIKLTIHLGPEENRTRQVQHLSGTTGELPPRFAFAKAVGADETWPVAVTEFLALLAERC